MFVFFYFISCFLFFVFFFFFFQSSNSNEVESRFFVLPLNEINLEPSENVYTNLVMQNPLENPTNLATVTTAINTNEFNASTSNFIAQNPNITSPYAMQSYEMASQQQPLSYTTQSLTTPIKGIIPKLQHEESKGIPIPGRAQSHDDIRMLAIGSGGSGYNSPNSNYGLSPNSPHSQYMYGCSPMGLGSNSSPPINYNSGSYPTKGGITIARRALSRATSPLSSSVPSSTTNIPKITSSGSSSRYIAVSKNCSRSEQKCQFHAHNQ